MPFEQEKQTSQKRDPKLPKADLSPEEAKLLKDLKPGEKTLVGRRTADGMIYEEENLEDKSGNKSQNRGKDSKSVSGEELDGAKNQKGLQNLKSPDSDFTRSLLKKQFLGEDAATRTQTKPLEILQNNRSVVMERQFKTPDQNLVQQQSVLQMWTRKVSDMFRPAKRADIMEVTQRRPDQPRIENSVQPLKNLTSLFERVKNNPAVEAWQRQNTDSLSQKQVRPATVSQIPERVTSALKSAWNSAKDFVIPSPPVVPKTLKANSESIEVKPLAKQIIKTLENPAVPRKEPSLKDAPQKEMPRREVILRDDVQREKPISRTDIRQKTETPLQTKNQTQNEIRQPQVRTQEMRQGKETVLPKEIIQPQVRRQENRPAEIRQVEVKQAELKPQQSTSQKPPLQQSQPKLQPQPASVNMLDQLQKELLTSIKARNEKIQPSDEAKVKAVIRESVELKRFVENIYKQDPNPTQAAKEQVQRTVQEALRIAGSQMPKELTAELVKTLVSNTVAKLGAFYGQETPKKGPPPVQPGNTPAPATAPPPGTPANFPFRPGSGAGAAASYLKSPNAPPEEPQIEKKEIPEREEKEVKREELDNENNGELYPGYKKKIKEDRFLTVQRTYTISGTVMEKKGQKGISGVFINGGGLGTAVTDSKGEFRFYNVPEGKVYTLTFLKRGYKFSPGSITDTLDGPHRHYVYGLSES
jgi:hypothetical protein